MKQTSTFLFNPDSGFAPVSSGPYPAPSRKDTTFEKIIDTAGDVGSVLTEIDRVLNPGNYRTQALPQPQTAGFGWGKALLLAGVAGSVIYAGKQVYDKQKKKAN